MDSVSQKYNLGLQLLRTLMSFVVVLDHFWMVDDRACPFYLMPFKHMLYTAVPVFMLLSFLLTWDKFEHATSAWARKRLWRIFLPQLAWAFIYFAVYAPAGIADFTQLLWQIVTGHTINRSMWFQFDLLVITTFFCVVFLYAPAKCRWYIVAGALYFAEVATYAGLNWMLFGHLRDELCAPLGRIIEMTPYAVIGLFLGRYGVIGRLKQHRTTSIVSLCLIGGFFLRFSVFQPVGGFTYEGTNLLVAAIVIVLISALLPIENLPEQANAVLSVVSRHTLGIYCCHRLVAYYLYRFYENRYSFSSCIVIYLVSYLVCELLSRIPYLKSIID